MTSELQAAKERVRATAKALQKYVADYADALTWGGPTIYPKHPIDERKSAQLAADLATLLAAGGEGERAPEAGGWRPIETAPKDGTSVDLWTGTMRYPDCRWGMPAHECGEAGKYCDSDWHSEEPGWVDDTFNSFLGSEPTHWMPLPAAPQQGEE